MQWNQSGQTSTRALRKQARERWLRQAVVRVPRPAAPAQPAPPREPPKP